MPGSNTRLQGIGWIQHLAFQLTGACQPCRYDPAALKFGPAVYIAELLPAGQRADALQPLGHDRSDTARIEADVLGAVRQRASAGGPHMCVPSQLLQAALAACLDRYTSPHHKMLLHLHAD